MSDRRPDELDVFVCGDVLLDLGMRRAYRGARSVELTMRECTWLRTKLNGDASSIEELVDRVRDENPDPFSTIGRVTAMTLRRKFGDLATPDDEGGTAGDRKPRRPLPHPDAGAAEPPDTGPDHQL